MNQSAPELVVFDLDGTLYEYEQANKVANEYLIEIISEETNKPITEIEKLLKLARNNVKERLGQTGSSHSRILYINELFRLMKINPRATFILRLEQSFWSKYFQNMIIREDVYNLISLLRSAKIEISLITDLTLQIQLRKLVVLDLDDSFDSIFSSEELGGDKITGVPFKTLRSHYPSKEIIWYIGDKEWDFESENVPNTFYYVGKMPKKINGKYAKPTNFAKIYKELEALITN
jgi:putative hydrolase of the HAD superfamily